MTSGETVTRFAPSPTGYLHIGHVYSAWQGWQRARGDGGRFLLRLEDIDRTRCRDEFATAIIEDLAWLGLCWDGPVRRQSEHFGDYRGALDRLEGMGVLYPCFCTRREIAIEIGRSGAAPQGEVGTPYPGTCRRLPAAERGLGAGVMALVGFSQGAMMSLFVGLRRARPIAGILGYSGRLLAPELLESELRSRPRVLLVHGTADPLVPYESLATAQAALAAADVPIETLTRPGIGHAIDEAGLRRGGEFLNEVLAHRAPATAGVSGGER